MTIAEFCAKMADEGLVDPVLLRAVIREEIANVLAESEIAWLPQHVGEHDVGDPCRDLAAARRGAEAANADIEEQPAGPKIIQPAEGQVWRCKTTVSSNMQFKYRGRSVLVSLPGAPWFYTETTHRRGPCPKCYFPGSEPEPAKPESSPKTIPLADARRSALEAQAHIDEQYAEPEPWTPAEGEYFVDDYLICRRYEGFDYFWCPARKGWFLRSHLPIARPLAPDERIVEGDDDETPLLRKFAYRSWSADGINMTERFGLIHVTEPDGCVTIRRLYHHGKPDGYKPKDKGKP